MPVEGVLNPINCKDMGRVGYRPDRQPRMERMHWLLLGERSESLSGEALPALPVEGALSPNNCAIDLRHKKH
jgi:hypothetical protein